ncbi:hypothetical protein OL239_12780 [Arthrobacter sp. ATA002]|uniref:hypothetical protein n=1 Tax=Arthrobacter sp. ATA002 TaxID=2991715 RepID=UPI0022A7B386|nr:hypothetical protein [Arthrobacter sp. ATA002]WAP50857.1 hypothetical protein OL239_12780 [Arthrobacter sp. ATA002]
MPEAADVIGSILELLSWMGLAAGIPLVLIGRAIRRRRCVWISTTAEVFEAGGFKGLRWSDGESTPRLSLHTAEQTRGLEPGTVVALHYDACHPARWGLGEPREENPALAVGWTLTAVGAACTLAGFFLMLV